MIQSFSFTCRTEDWKMCTRQFHATESKQAVFLTVKPEGCMLNRLGVLVDLPSTDRTGEGVIRVSLKILKAIASHPDQELHIVYQDEKLSVNNATIDLAIVAPYHQRLK